MASTIEILESIGKDASLRRASADTLSAALTEMGASEALRQASVSGECGPIAQELGRNERYQVVKTDSQAIPPECPDDDDDDDDRHGDGPDERNPEPAPPKH